MEPKITIFSPGDREVGNELAAFCTATTVGVITGAAVTVRVMGKVTGEFETPATVMVTEP